MGGTGKKKVKGEERPALPQEASSDGGRIFIWEELGNGGNGFPRFISAGKARS